MNLGGGGAKGGQYGVDASFGVGVGGGGGGGGDGGGGGGCWTHGLEQGHEPHFTSVSASWGSGVWSSFWETVALVGNENDITKKRSIRRSFWGLQQCVEDIIFRW